MISEHIELILTITGVLTAGMIVQSLIPTVAVRKIYGEDLRGDAALLTSRHWGILVFCFGALLLWSAKHTEIRHPIIIAAIVEKTMLAIFIFASPFRNKPIPLIIAGGDTLMAVTYIAYLLGF